MSCGFYSWIDIVKDAVDEALRKPTLIFAAASNNGTRKKVAFPAYLPGVICINASNANGGSSDFNPTFDPSRPFSILGVNVPSTYLSTSMTHKRMTGTSVATPIAAGIAGLLHEFALQTDPADESTDKMLKAQLNWLKGYNGIVEIFNLMAEVRDGYRNIVPWNFLSVDFERVGVAQLLKIAMLKKFGSS